MPFSQSVVSLGLGLSPKVKRAHLPSPRTCCASRDALGASQLVAGLFERTT
jgi:hypothetical protein